MTAAGGAIKDWTVSVPRLPFSMPGRLLAPLLALLAASQPAASQSVIWRSVTPTDISGPAAFKNPRLSESSGLAVSRTQPGIYWTHNDSGDDPVLYATDSLGRDLGMFWVTGAKNYDWEAIARAPCDGGDCLYIGDTGDNTERRKTVAVYKVREPIVQPGAGTLVTDSAFRLVIKYPDGPHDTEALVVTPSGDLLLITKGRSHGVRLFRVAATAWHEPAPALAQFIAQLPIEPSARTGRRVTDAALAPDGKRVVVRTYSGLFFFMLDGYRLTPADPPVVCETGALQLQGEGVDWLPDGRLALSSEAALGMGRGSLAFLRCPTQ